MSNKKRFGQVSGIIAILLLIIVVFVIFHFITGGNFLTWQNIKLVLLHSTIPTMTALGLCFLFATGYTDLSVGAIIIIGSNAAGEAALLIGIPGLIIAPVIIAFGCILLNFIVSKKLRLPSWISGIAMAMVYEAVAGYYSSWKISSGSTTVSLGKSYRELGSMPWAFIVVAVGVVVAWFIYTRTKAGISIRALGSNAVVAKHMGVDEKKMMLMTAIIAAIFIGIASGINISYSGKQLSCSGLTSIVQIFEPLAILLLAQSMGKKISLPIGIFLSSILVAGLFNALTWIGVPSGSGQEAVEGLLVLVCAIFAVRGTKGVVK